MVDGFVDAFIEKLLLLERRAGATVHYRLMAPLTRPLNDVLEIQALAKDIARFVGLDGLTFVVAIAKQEASVGGQIDLATEGSGVFIEIDSDMMNFPDAVAATLCHEVCHKWLHVRGIRSSPEIDNEILTDITAVFLGFGKIMLNGCQTSRVRYDPTPGSTQRFTETMRAGYLDRGQLAFVYRLTCAMRSVPPAEYMAGLNTDSKEAIRNCDARYAHHYDSKFHLVEETARRTTDINSRVAKLQRTMGDLQKHMTYVKRSLCAVIDDHLLAGHKAVQSIETDNRNRTELTAEPDPALRFLRAITVYREFMSAEERIDSILRKTEGYLEDAKTVGRYVRRSNMGFPTPSSAMFTIITCPNDGTNLRLPENSGDVIATCPKCKYRFHYNTGPLVFHDQLTIAAARPRPTWLQRLRNTLRLRG